MGTVRNTTFFFFVFFFLLFSANILIAAEIEQERIAAGVWETFKNLTNYRRGDDPSPALALLRNYFRRFGYLHNASETAEDMFDEAMESAIKTYQANLGLNVSGYLDAETVSLLMTPRCGREDLVNGSKWSPHRKRGLYTYFPGRPRWPAGKTELTYAFDPEAGAPSTVGDAAMRDVFRRAFSRWADAIPITFTETDDFASADLTVGFHLGDHGDGEPFDGVLGTLAHAFSPPDGRFHLDGAETWTVDLEQEKSSVAVDLESIATHEIGHLLGLGHSSVKEAIMYPSISARHRKVELMMDDIEGIQSLYGANPDFNVSEISTSQYDDTSFSASGAPSAPFLLAWLLPLATLLFLRR